MSENLTSTDRAGFLGAVLTGSLGACWGMFTLGYALRLPGLEAPGPVAGVLILLAFALAVALTAKASGRRAAVKVGAASGFLAGLVGLIVIGSLLSAPEAGQGLAPRSAWMFAGWMALTSVGGGVFGWVGGRRAPEDRRLPAGRVWLPRLAWIAGGATLALIAKGGIVTAAEAGMAVPDWPRSFGANMFLYPLSKMTGGIFYEHAHRLMGAFVGLVMIALLVLTLLVERRGRMKAFALLLLVLVSAQGVVGGLRVTENNAALAVPHAIAAQVILTLIACFALASSGVWREAGEPIGSRAGGLHRRLAVVAFGAVLAQIVLGAVLRHFPQSLHALMTHVGFSLVALTAVVAAGFHASTLKTAPLQRRLGKAMAHTVGLQMVLGGLALWAFVVHRDTTPKPAADLVLTTAHQVIGAILLAITGMSVASSRRFLRPARWAPASDAAAAPA